MNWPFPPVTGAMPWTAKQIKEALAQPEQETPRGWAPEVWNSLQKQEPDGIVLTNISHPKGAPAPDDLNADALEVVELELPDEDEAVGWADGGVINWIAGKQFKHASYLYAAPPQRTWVGLTDDEFDEIWRMDLNNKDIMDKTIAKLKEKNT